MSDDTHTDDLRNVKEGDSVTLTTTDGHHFDAECESRAVERAAEGTGEVRKTTIWEFSAVEWEPVVSITDGLRSSPSDPEFPKHTEMWAVNQEQTLGYIESLQIHTVEEA